METRGFEEDLASVLEKRSFKGDFVLPDYEGLCVKNLASVVGKVFGVDSFGASGLSDCCVDEFGGVRKVILLIVDGLGYRRLLSHMKSHDGAFADLATNGVLKPLTTVFPSTTSTVLTSIFTGLSPSEHGVLGYQMFSKEYGVVFNTLEMKPVYGYNREVDLAESFARRFETWMPKLQEHDVTPQMVTMGAIAGSGLSRVIHRDLPVTTYRLSSDMLAQCGKVLQRQDQTLVTLYYSGVDGLEHRYGPYSEEVSFELSSLESNLKHFLGTLPDEIKKQTLVLVTADHGVAETQQIVYLKDVPQVSSRLMLPPLGDARASFLFSNPGQSDAVAAAFRENVGGFKLFPSEQLIEAGSFGKPANSDALRQNVGDFTALGNAKTSLQYPFYEDDRAFEHLGSHGGMTVEEMVVPLLSARLSDW